MAPKRVETMGIHGADRDTLMRIDNHTHVGFDPLFYTQGWSPYCLDLPRLFNEAAGCDIDAFVVFPFVAYMALDMAAIRRNQIELSTDADAVPYAFENRRLCNDILRAPKEWQARLWPFLMADPSRKPEDQVRAWQALPSDYTVYGLKFQTHTIQSPILAMLDEGACMLDYAEAHDMPLLIHTSIRAEDKWSQCSDILRVAESRPNVRFVLAHSCRFHKPTLDRVAELPNAWFDCSAFITHCVCAQRDLPAVAQPADRFETDYTSPETVLQDLAQAYPGKLIWGSDAPYYSIEYDRLQIRSSYRREVACLDALPAPARERVCCQNTLAWLGSRAPSSR